VSRWARRPVTLAGLFRAPGRMASMLSIMLTLASWSLFLAAIFFALILYIDQDRAVLSRLRVRAATREGVRSKWRMWAIVSAMLWLSVVGHLLGRHFASIEFGP
jgi:hypothetical protein